MRNNRNKKITDGLAIDHEENAMPPFRYSLASQFGFVTDVLIIIQPN